MNELERGRLERGIHLAGEAMSVVVLAIVAWYYIDPSAEPKVLLERAWETGRHWLSERLSRAEAFRRTLWSIRDLPEREEP